MSSKIYTRTGDKGSTSLIGGTKVPKNNIRIDSYGTVDELNSFIGLVSDELKIASPDAGAPARRNPTNSFTLSGDTPSASIPTPLFAAETALLREIQDRLFTIGASLACDPEKEPKQKIPDLKKEDIQRLEEEIDRMNEVLPPMKSFVHPGGHPAVSTAHIARCVCRRAERICVDLKENDLFIEPIVLQYLNRLSDYLFMLARYAGHLLHAPEIPWRPRV